MGKYLKQQYEIQDILKENENQKKLLKEADIRYKTMEDKIMCFVGICISILMLALAGAIITTTITRTLPKKQIEMELK